MTISTQSKMVSLEFDCPISVDLEKLWDDRSRRSPSQSPMSNVSLLPYCVERRLMICEQNEIDFSRNRSTGSSDCKLQLEL